MHWLEILKIISTCYITYGSSDGIWTQGAEIRYPIFFKIVKFLWGFVRGENIDKCTKSSTCG